MIAHYDTYIIRSEAPNHNLLSTGLHNDYLSTTSHSPSLGYQLQSNLGVTDWCLDLNNSIDALLVGVYSG